MIHTILSALWDSAFAQFGIAGLTLAACGFLFFFTPPELPGLRHLTIMVGTGCVVFLFATVHFYNLGIRYEKAKWDAAEAAAAKRATDARTEAEREIAAEPPAAAPDLPAVDSGGGRDLSRVLHPRRVRNDRFDRDHP